MATLLGHRSFGTQGLHSGPVPGSIRRPQALISQRTEASEEGCGLRRPLSRQNGLLGSPRQREKLPTAVASQSPVLSDESSEQAEQAQQFRWEQNWYAVASAADLDQTVPHALTVLEQPMVLWFDKGTQQWTCFADECPHRLAPLSEGRIDENGQLQCSYHGWTFKGDGGCTRIPQAAAQGPEAKANTNRRACAKAFPTQVAQGLIFVWPDSTSTDRAAATPLPVVPGIDDSFNNIPLVRDLQYGYEMLAENVVDVSHLPFAHHGVGMLRREKGSTNPCRVTESGATGFKGVIEKDVFQTKSSLVDFDAPGRYTYERRSERDGKSFLSYTNLYITPIAPGKSRIIIANRLDLKNSIFNKLPRWLNHLKQQDILDGDALFLHVQERALADQEADPNNWAQNYFMPTAADRFVIAFRQWLAKYAGGQVQYLRKSSSSLPAGPVDKKVILDRYNGHTKGCVTCSKALQDFQKLQRNLVAVAVVLLTTTCVLGTAEVPLWGRASLGVLALGCFAASASLQPLIQLFIYRGYDHTKVDKSPPVLFD